MPGSASAAPRPAAARRAAAGGRRPERPAALRRGRLRPYTLAAADANATVGPDLDELSRRDPAYVEESIREPNATVVRGFPANVMPDDFGDRRRRRSTRSSSTFSGRAEEKARTLTHKLLAPGWYRATLGVAAGFGWEWGWSWRCERCTAMTRCSIGTRSSPSAR